MFQDTSCRAMNQGGNRIDAALDLLRAAMAAGATSSEGSSSRSTTPIHRKPAPPAVPGLYMEQHVNGAPPALPPRTAPSHHMEPPQPPRVPPIVHPVNGGAHPVVTRKYSPSGVNTSTRGDLPPPLPPPRGGTGHNPPPTPPRGTTPPPSSMSKTQRTHIVKHEICTPQQIHCRVPYKVDSPFKTTVAINRHMWYVKWCF